MKIVNDVLVVLYKNRYLFGLEKLFKKYGISVVYSSRPCTGGYQFNEYYVPKDLSHDAWVELMEYSSRDEGDDFGIYHDISIGDVPKDMKIFYDGQFYGRDVCTVQF